MSRVEYCLITLLVALLSTSMPAHARETGDSILIPMYAKIYSNEWEIDTTRTGQLTLSFNSTLFFRDNEYDTPMMKGYTLPGFRLRPSVEYRPSGTVNIEFGLYLLRFWGTDAYPNMSYIDMSEWKGVDNAAKGFHLLPFFRAQMGTRGGVNFVLGSIYGGGYHRLLEPLYAPELNLTADPEAGVQILYSNRWVDFDSWVNWESFIYKGDTHQEAFTFGVSSTLKYNRVHSPVHLYSPVQMLFQHRGGEIDTLHVSSVQTLFNGAAGIGARFNIDHRAVKALTIEADALVYNQQKGSIWPFKDGRAWYAHAHLDIDELRVRVGYFKSRRFISLFGYPFFGGVSTSVDGLTFDSNSTLLFGLDYHHEFARGYSLGASAVAFSHFNGMGLQDGQPVAYRNSLSFAGTLYFRINPSFLIARLSQ